MRYVVGAMRIHVVLNANARHGGEATRRALAERLPTAQVELTHSVAEVDALAERLVRQRPDLVLSAGGDGTALSLLNALRRASRSAPGTPLVRLGLLMLGTGNGWARSSGAPRLGPGLTRLSEFASSDRDVRDLPTSRFDLIEVERTLTHFAGTGWDAELIDDFHAQKSGPSVIPERARHGLAGYLNGLFTRAVPRNLALPQVEIEVENTGSDALGIDRRGRPFALPDAGRGAILYRGPASVCGVGTSTQWGFGFRAFPFARLVPGRMNLRLYGATTKQALARIPMLWAGRHPMPLMHTWLVDRCVVRFSRHVALQAGGDLLGHRDHIEYAVSGESVDVLDWRALGRLLGAPDRRLKDAVVGHLEPALAMSGILGD